MNKKEIVGVVIATFFLVTLIIQIIKVLVERWKK